MALSQEGLRASRMSLWWMRRSRSTGLLDPSMRRVGEETGTSRAWARFKLQAAAWYVELLDELGSRYGFARLVGIEMAMDGALSALSSAFDAAVAGLIVASEERLEVRAKDFSEPAPTRTAPHRYDWSVARKYLCNPTVPGNRPSVVALSKAVVTDVDAALASDGQSGVGWLEELRRLRNRTTHQDTLARHIAVNVGGEIAQRTDWQLTVAGIGHDPVTYLREVHGRLERLLDDRLLQTAELLAPGGRATSQAGVELD